MQKHSNNKYQKLNKTKLTIAIPTFNRCDYIAECLDSIVNQIIDGVEIYIKDNASTDDTCEVVKNYKSKYPFIRYSKNDQNIGPDANFLLCLQEGRGDYIHLMSDDDILLPGAVSAILKTIDSQTDIAIIRTNCCSFEKQFNPKLIGKPAYDISEKIIFNDKNEFLQYVGFASVFMSTTVYNKQIVNRVSNPSRYIGTNLLQTHLIYECLAINSKAIILSDVCIAARIGMSVRFDLCRVLVIEWKKVLYETCMRCNYDIKTVRHAYNATIKANLAGIIRDVHISEPSYGSVFKLIFSATWMFPSAWLFLYPYALLPKSILKLLSMVKKRINKAYTY